jgi:hypothetical protein
LKRVKNAFKIIFPAMAKKSFSSAIKKHARHHLDEQFSFNLISSQHFFFKWQQRQRSCFNLSLQQCEMHVSIKIIPVAITQLLCACKSTW